MRIGTCSRNSIAAPLSSARSLYLSSVLSRNAPARDVLPVLRATLSLGRASLADVDGDIIGIGEEVNGYRLLAVNEGSAVFSKDGKRLELSVGTTTRETRR